MSKYSEWPFDQIDFDPSDGKIELADLDALDPDDNPPF